MIFKSKQFQYWQKHIYVHNLTLDKYRIVTLPETTTKIQIIMVTYKSIVSVLRKFSMLFDMLKW